LEEIFIKSKELVLGAGTGIDSEKSDIYDWRGV